MRLFGSSSGTSADRSERNQERMPIRDSPISTARNRVTATTSSVRHAERAVTRAVRSLRGLPLEPAPGAVRISGSGACRAEGLGSDEETGIGRGHAGLDRPRLRADGARAGPPRGARTPGAWSLVPDGNRSVPSPAVAAAVYAGTACAGTGAGLIQETVVRAEFG